MTIAIIIPLYNQVHFTKLCLDSLSRYTRDDIRIIAIDNASSDDTAAYLSSLDNIVVISNRENRGCAGAWNQGVEAAADADWLVILNNDIIASPKWLEGLIEASTRWKLDVVCPAIREGEYNYEIESYGPSYVSKMRTVIRRHSAHGICFMVHRRVFDAIGLFDENFRIGQYEDKDFFLRARQSGFAIGTVGCSFLHHFGSVTQKAMGAKREKQGYALENKAYFTRKWRLSWWKRAVMRNKEKLVNWLQSSREHQRYGHTLLEKWLDGRLRYD